MPVRPRRCDGRVTRTDGSFSLRSKASTGWPSSNSGKKKSLRSTLICRPFRPMFRCKVSLELRERVVKAPKSCCRSCW
jgi:hypothetical protein